MEVHLNPELQAKLAGLAAKQGRGTNELVEDAPARYVEDETRFLEAVEEGIAAAERGEFVEDEEVWARVQQIVDH